MGVTQKMINDVDVGVFTATVNAVKDDPKKGATVRIEGDADRDAIQKVYDRVVKYSPGGLTLSRPVDVRAEFIYNGS